MGPFRFSEEIRTRSHWRTNEDKETKMRRGSAPFSAQKSEENRNLFVGLALQGKVHCASSMPSTELEKEKLIGFCF